MLELLRLWPYQGMVSCSHPGCPLYSLHYFKNEHCCLNPSYLGGENLCPILNCYLASPAKCSNCEGNHSASFHGCLACPAPLPLRAIPLPTMSPSTLLYSHPEIWIWMTCLVAAHRQHCKTGLPLVL